MDANIRRHAYTDYSGRAYIDNHSAPAAVAQYCLPLVQHAPTESRTIIRTNQTDKLYPQPSPRNQYFPPIPQAKCGCDKYGPAPALAPRPKLAPAARPKLAPTARPKLAPAPAFPKFASLISLRSIAKAILLAQNSLRSWFHLIFLYEITNEVSFALAKSPWRSNVVR